MSFTADLAVIIEKNEGGVLSTHESWERVELGDVAAVLNGFPFDSKLFSKGRGIPLIRIRDILNLETDVGFVGEVPEGYWIKKGDILIGMDGDFNVARWKGGDALLNQRVCKIIVNGKFIESGFFFHTIGGYLKAINEYTSSVTVKHLSSKTIADIALPLPPLAEQKRIADKLDSLLARVDVCRERLDRVLLVLKRFRQSVLAAATSGQLTEDWREKQGIELRWNGRKLSELGEIGRGKSKHRPRNDPQLYGGPYPFIQTGDIAQSHEWILSHTQTYNDVGLSQSKIWPKGTLCITIAANIADTAILSYPACFPDSVVGFVADETKCLPQFVKWSIDVIKKELDAFAPATAQKNINLAVLHEVTVNCPTLDEQAEIVRRVEILFAFADRLEARLSTARNRAERLTPALLAKAFRGELVPQDPDDEPASVLLERIRTARQTGVVMSGNSAFPKFRSHGEIKHKSEVTMLELSQIEPNHLTAILKEKGRLTSKALYQIAHLHVDDFYEQLRSEEGKGFLREVKEDNESYLEAT